MQSALVNFCKGVLNDKVKVRFILAGIINTVFGLSAYPIIYYSLAKFNLHYLVILFISQVICITFSYATNKVFVFKTTGNVWSEYIKFSSFYLSYFLVNLGALPFMVEILKMNPIFAQIIFTFVVAISSFFWHSKISFAKNN